MDYRELIKLSENYQEYLSGETMRFEFIAVPKKTMCDVNNNEVYIKDYYVEVNIDKFKDEDKYQIYRATGCHVTGNSHKCYKSLELLFEDFKIISLESLLAEEGIKMRDLDLIDLKHGFSPVIPVCGGTSMEVKKISDISYVIPECPGAGLMVRAKSLKIMRQRYLINQ